MTRYTLRDFDYALPRELIAQSPAPVRRGSRLLHVAGTMLSDLQFSDLPSLFATGDLLVFNDTRVIKSRMVVAKPTGGRVELLLERITGDNEALFQMRASHPPKTGHALELPDGVRATVTGRDDRFFRLHFDGIASVSDYLDRWGELPLPPYIERPADATDAERYQTVYARNKGAVAAPTAGLHFDTAMLASLESAGVLSAFVTLHVGAGTFAPVRSEDLSAHHMHAERYRISQVAADAIAAARQRRARIVAVGTTSLRALESAAGRDGVVHPRDAETQLFITAGFRFRAVDRLLTNFHLPMSTLLMLVSAFAGHDTIRNAYAHAIEQRYRFFSYGDAMLLERADIG